MKVMDIISSYSFIKRELRNWVYDGFYAYQNLGWKEGWGLIELIIKIEKQNFSCSFWEER
jgi:hypothetical protein